MCDENRKNFINAPPPQLNAPSKIRPGRLIEVIHIIYHQAPRAFKLASKAVKSF